MRDKTNLVFVNGQYKGEVYRNPRSKRLEWFTDRRGKEGFPARATLDDVRDAIASVCLVDPSAVTFETAYY